MIAVLAAACGGPQPENVTAETPSVSQHARDLTRASLLVDTHIDVPYRVLEEGDLDLSRRTEGGHFDYPRAKEGGLDAPFMSIYIPASLQESGGAKEHAEMLIDMVEGFVERWPDKFALASSPDEVEANFDAGLMSLPMGMENGAPIETLEDLDHFHRRGIRYITLTHAENNQICDSSYATDRKWNGLSDYGREVVKEMNRLGIMVDISHVSDQTFDQVLEITKAPVIASHSSCRRFTPNWERNMSDDMIRALAGNGGVIQINFGSAFVDTEANAVSMAMWKAYGEFLKREAVGPESEEAQAEMKRLREAHVPPAVPMQVVADNIDHVVELVGIDHVGIGSDYDGVTSVPDGLDDVSTYPALVDELLHRGYSDEEIRQLLGGNLMRVWRQVETVAAAS